MPARAPHSMLMLQTVNPAFHRHLLERPTRGTRPCSPVRRPVPVLAITARMTVLRRYALRQLPFTVTAIVLGRPSCSVCVASTCSTCRGPMPNASAPTRPVRRGVRVAAHDCQTGLGKAQLGDRSRAQCPARGCPWNRAAPRNQHSSYGGSRPVSGSRDRRWATQCVRSDVMVFGGQREIRTANGPSRQAQAFEGLRARNLVGRGAMSM
jgi:hypothetical protein